MEKHRILIVDDEPNIRSSLSRLFEREGYETVLAENAVDAFAILERKPISVVISDYMMPGRCGIDLLREVKERSPGSVRIILSGKADMKAVMNAVKEGIVSHFLVKPWDNEVLRNTLQQAVRQLEKQGASPSSSKESDEEENLDLEKTYPGITRLNETEEGAIIIDE